jgi:hypothetical protein
MCLPAHATMTAAQPRGSVLDPALPSETAGIRSPFVLRHHSKSLLLTRREYDLLRYENPSCFLIGHSYRRPCVTGVRRHAPGIVAHIIRSRLALETQFNPKKSRFRAQWQIWAPFSRLRMAVHLP